MDNNVHPNQGIIFKKSTGTYYVNAAGETVVCSISATLRKQLVYPIADPSSLRRRVQDVHDIKLVDPVAVGDVVTFTDTESGDDTRAGRIDTILPRKNKLTRQYPGKKPLEQVIVANIDQTVAVFAAAQPKPKWNLLDRYLASAEASEVPAVIAITKFDLVRGKRAESAILEAVEMYRDMGYPVLLTSAEDGIGIDAFRDIAVGRISVFVGKSGVGKTSLLNALQPDLGLKVSAINTTIDKGRHTTTHLELFYLDAGGAVVDTPGMKQFGLWNVIPEDLPDFFVEMRPYIGECRFGLSCQHDHEPGCAIKQAVENGHISEQRYASFLALRSTLDAE